MNQKEQEIVEISDRSYNLTIGGRGGFYYINSNGLNAGANNVMHNPIIKNKIIEAGKKTRAKNPEHYKKISINNLSKTWKLNKGKKRPQHSDFMKMANKERWKDTVYKEKIRDKNSSSYLIESPLGKSIITNRLREFCQNNNLPFVTIWTAAVNNRIITKGKAKGWKCQIIAQ